MTFRIFVAILGMTAVAALHAASSHSDKEPPVVTTISYSRSMDSEEKTLKEQFKDAKRTMKFRVGIPPRVSMQLFGLHSQATAGDVQGPRPTMTFLDPVGFLPKWEAWNDCRGMSQEDAMLGYINIVNEHLADSDYDGRPDKNFDEYAAAIPKF